MTDEPDPFDPTVARWVTIRPAPPLAALLDLPEQLWYCALMLIDGEACTAISLSEEAFMTLQNMNTSGIEPPEEFMDWAGNQFVTRPGWPVHWLQEVEQA